MRYLLFTLLLAACGKSDSKGPAAAEPPSFADVKGVVITRTDVLLDGKSLGVLPARLVDDRTALATGLHAAQPKGPLALSYTDDAPAPVVLAAMRAMGEASAPPVPAADNSSGGSGQAMALDEGKMGSADSRARAIEAARTAGVLGSEALTSGAGAPYSISALGSGKPQRVCDARATGANNNDEERVDLSVKIGAKHWQIALSRVNEFEELDAIEKVAPRLKDHKQSAFFQDRTDAEIVAEPGTTGAELTPVLAAACATGFFEIRPLTVAELAAQLGPATSPHEPPPASSTVSIGQPNAQGDLDKAIIRRYIKRNQPQLSYCYERELLAKPTLSGTVSAQFAIKPDGTVVGSTATGVDPAVADCVAGVIKGIEFPKPKDGGIVQVNYPFTFHSAAHAAQP